MKIFAVDQGLFNGKENDKRGNKRTERKLTNQHVSELNVSINGLMNGNYGNVNGKCKMENVKETCDSLQGKW